MRRSILLSAAVFAAPGFVSIPLAGAATVEGFQLRGQSVDVDRNAGTATFQLTFDREPRFFLPHGGGGDQPDSFQIEIDADRNTFEQPILFDDIDSVIRGAEIFAGDGIPVRDREGDDGDNAGGWGPIRALVPFELDDTTLTFTTGLSAIGDDDGRFRYRIITTESGSLTGEVSAAIIPLPAAVWTGVMLLGGAGIISKLRKRSFC